MGFGDQKILDRKLLPTNLHQLSIPNCHTVPANYNTAVLHLKDFLTGLLKRHLLLCL
jgi:hypothetical protein